MGSPLPVRFAAIRNEVNLLPFPGRVAGTGRTIRPHRQPAAARAAGPAPPRRTACPASQRPCVLRVIQHTREAIRHTDSRALLGQLPDLSAHTPHTGGPPPAPPCPLPVHALGRARTSVVPGASPVPPLRRHSRGQPRSRLIPATDKIVVPVAATPAIHQDRCHPPGTAAGKPSGSTTTSHTPPPRRYADTTGTRRPANGCRGFVSSTSAGSRSKPRSLSPTLSRRPRLDPPEAARPGRRRPVDLADHRLLRPALARPRPRRRPAAALAAALPAGPPDPGPGPARVPQHPPDAAWPG